MDGPSLLVVLVVILTSSRGAIRSISWIACNPPQLEKKEGEVTLEEVDQLFRLALTTSWCKCGDDHAHGQAIYVWIHYSGVLARAFAREQDGEPHWRGAFARNAEGRRRRDVLKPSLC